MARPVVLNDMVDIFLEEEMVQNAINAWNLALTQVSLFRWIKTDAAEIMRERTNQRFMGEGDDVSGKWAELRPFTIGARERAGFPGAHPINVRTGRMKHWLTQDSGKPEMFGAASVRLTFPGETSADNPLLETKLSVAQQGKTTAPVTVARPVLGVNAVDMVLMLTSLRDYLITSANTHMGATADLNVFNSL